jgi:hypothetical protein
MRKALCYEIRQFSGVSSEDEPPVTRRLPAFDASRPVQRTMRNGAPGRPVWTEQDWHTWSDGIVVATCASRFIGDHTRLAEPASK